MSEQQLWQRAHQRLVELARASAALDFEQARWLVVAERERVHEQLGLGSLREYLERVFGYPPRLAEERLRVAKTLCELPALREALRDGSLCWSAVRELSRVATADTESEWIAAARGQTVRQVEQRVSGRRRGDRPGSPVPAGAERRVLRFEVTAETYALFRDARAHVERTAGEALDDDTALAELARQVLGSPADAGRSSYQIAVTTCAHCDRGFVQGRITGELVEVGAAALSRVQCDAQHIGSVEGTDKTARATQTIPPAIRRRVMRRDHGRCVVPGCRASRYVDVHHLVPRADGGTHDPDQLCVLCGSHHRRVHDGKLVIAGRCSTGLSFRHADGRPYGAVVELDTGAAGLFADAYSALRHMGWADRETRRALDQVRPHVGPGVELLDVIRSALRELGSRAA